MRSMRDNWECAKCSGVPYHLGPCILLGGARRDLGRKHQDLSGIEAIGIDEIAWQRGHRYLTLVSTVSVNQPVAQFETSIADQV